MGVFRRSRYPYLKDEETGDIIDTETGLVADQATITDLLSKDPEEGRIHASNLMEEVDQLMETLDNLKFGFLNGELLVRPLESNPDIKVGETNLVEGAGNEDQVFLTKVENLKVSKRPNVAKVLTSIQKFVLRLEEWEQGANTPINDVGLIELADIIDMISDNIVPIANSSHILRLGERFKRLLVNEQKAKEETNEIKQRYFNLNHDHDKLEHNYQSVVGHLRKSQKNLNDILKELDKVFTKFPFYLKLFREAAEAFTRDYGTGNSELLKLLSQLVRGK